MTWGAVLVIFICLLILGGAVSGVIWVKMEDRKLAKKKIK